MDLNKGKVQFIAHRGASYLAPENTVASVKLAYELGADAAEVDIQLTGDHRIMVIHDKTTERTCTGKIYEVNKTPSPLLHELDAGSFKSGQFKGEKIPFLSEIVNLVPEEKKLVIDIKCDEEVIPILRRDLEKSGKLDRISFISASLEVLIEAKSEFPENDCYWLSDSKQNLEKKITEVSEARLQGVNLKYSIIDKTIVGLAKKLNLEVLGWTVDEPDEARRLIGLGVTKLITNRPKWLRDELAKQA